ncbi:MAG: YcnI family protein [Actinomycetota bacterium]|nr:YcnI family protein [Actinomycetota bacterium]
MHRPNPSRRRGPIARRCAVAATIAAVAAPFLLAGTAGAHISPQDPEAPSGSYFTTAFKVGHGCDGSPTTKVAIKMGDGVTSVKPQPVAGWNLTTTTRELDPPIDNHGTMITETVDEVIWEGGPLPDDELQMFWISMKLPEGEAGTAVEFPVVQTCETGETAWIEPVVEGQDEPEHPAPAVVLTAAADDGHGDDAATTTVAPSADGDSSSDDSSDDSSSDDGSDDGSSNGLAIGGLVLGALGLLTGGAALARSAKR